jgi:hypothetical protein
MVVFGIGSGINFGFISSPASIAGDGTATGNMNFFANEASGASLANGFGFGAGSGVAVNGANEQAGGNGGGLSVGQGDFKFKLDGIQNANFAISGTTTSSCGAEAFLNFESPSSPSLGLC